MCQKCQFYVTSFSFQDNIRELYVDAIRSQFIDTVVKKEDINNVKISFDANSEKVFVTFDRCQSIDDDKRIDWDTNQCSLPGKTLTEVYKAVKMRKMNIKTQITVLK